ncbi:MAG TPA: hypothetical protein PKB14_15910 [Rubrivivax sp.]|nr:hypothetical protein [Rubrivivax sp.]
MACNPLIDDPFDFPRRAHNRPALPHVAYRIGRCEDFVEAMLRRIDAAPPLQAWTHREPDDPAMALLQGAAIVGDILSFYQEHYANEAYLRTAAWRDSVAELVRLTGYRLAPGLGGRATFAFEVRGAQPVTIREGFPVKAELQDVPDPAEFQTEAELTAYPQLGRFRLYRQRIPASTLAAAATTIELTAVAGASDALSLAAFELRPGDKLMLMPNEAMFSTPGTAYSAQPAAQLVTVSKVTPRLGRVLIELESGPAQSWAAPVRAFRVGRSFRHFGHNAPENFVTPLADAAGTITGSKSAATRFERCIYYGDSTYGFGAGYTALDRSEMPLDIEAPDMAPGRRLIVQGRARFDGQPVPVPFTVTKTITAARGRSVSWGNLVGASTVLTLNDQLIANGSVLNEIADIRELRFHEVSSPQLTLRPTSGFAAGAFADGTNALYFYGTADEARPLAGRRLFLQHDDGRSAALVVTDAESAFASPSPAPRMWRLSFDRAPAPFGKGDFDEAAPTVTVFGNLADAAQGKAEREAVLGNGDATQAFQTFTLPKTPLTYFLAGDATPPQRPELEVWVGGRRWTRVDALFGRGPKDEVYIVREDAEGRSHVQFGDGETGARLPTGLKNVVAVFRSGNGARGPVKAGALPSAPERPLGFDKVSLAGIVAGGAGPEDADKAREAAPGKVQSLGRIVSLRDHETETLAIPGVVTASAAWDLHEGVPAVLLRVLLEAGREAEFAAVREAVAHAQRCRGPNRHPVIVQQALLRYVFCELTYARDPAFSFDAVDAALRAALGLAGDEANARRGLFGLHARRLGAREYASRIEGLLQNAAGVLWCKVVALGRFGGGVRDPATLPLPAAPRVRLATLSCAPRELLQLAARHLTLTEAAEPGAGECA